MLALCTLASPKLALAGDPRLEWYTIEAGDYRIHFHGGLEAIAQRAARLASQFEAHLLQLVGARHGEPTDILLTDDWDSANGFASTLPYSHIHLYVTAPDDMSALGQHDDWLPTLMIHESTHIAHVGQIAGLPSLYNAVLGRQLAPISLQPHWLKEGLSVYAESKLTGGGRLRSPVFDMMIRADVLDGHFAGLDQISAEPLRWPYGIYYLYGGKFVEFIANLYGPSIFAAVTQDASDDVIPFAISRPFYRATGRPLEDLYGAFQRATERRVADQLAAVVARGLREGRALTHHGRTAAYPRYVPARCRRGSDAPGREALLGDALVYYRDDGHERPGYYELPLAGPRGDADSLLVTLSQTGENASVADDCSLWFESRAVSRRRYTFNDLFRQLPGTTSPSGLDPSRERITIGRRATGPDLSPDGRRIVYVTNRAGTTTLQLAEVDSDGQLQNERVLAPSAQNEQVFTPRFSPDGASVIYSVWTHGGFRDLRIVEVASGRIRQLWKDRAVDQQPTFSRDGKWIYLSSDRSGIPNIYAYDLTSNKLWQVTNVRTGAFMPELSPDGKQLYYVGYSSRGFDLYTLPLVQERFLEPLPEPILHDDRIPLEDHGTYPVRRYSALTTLRPRAVEVNYQAEESGQRLTLSLKGTDIAELHSFKATAVFEPEGQGPDVSLRYAYQRLPIDFYLQAHRTTDLNRHYRYGTSRGPIDETRLGATSGLGLPFRTEFDTQYVSVEYRAENVSSVLPTGLAADPYATVPYEPRRGVASSIGVSYQYYRLESTHFALGDERGLWCYLALRGAHRGIGSELEGTRAETRVTGYVPLPWGHHHVLALSGFAGAATGDAFAGFTFGGYRDPELLRSLILGQGQGRLPLRGYPSNRFSGNRMLLGQSEYRFPLLVLDRGISTLPVFLRRIAGALSMDVGGAFNEFDPHQFDRVLHYSVASELWFDLVFSYNVGSRLVFGYAVGSGEGAYRGGTSYFAVGSSL